jgi:hypothetical protein
MKIWTQKTGGIWHGYIEGHPEVDERGLTEEIARRKVESVAARLAEERKGQAVSFRSSKKRLTGRTLSDDE